LPPIVNVGLIGDSGGGDFGMGCRHALRHRAPHTAQGLGWTAMGHALGSPFDIGPRDGAAGSRAVDELKGNAEFARESAHCRKHPELLPGGARRRDSCGLRSFAAAEFADNGAGVRFGALGKFDERHADLHDIALGAKQVRDASVRRRRYLNDRLVGLDG
jgi:hypothetical protein